MLTFRAGQYCKKMNLHCQALAEKNEAPRGTSAASGAPVVIASSAPGSRQSPMSTIAYTQTALTRGQFTPLAPGTLCGLEETPSRTPVYMGINGEQDPHVLSAFQLSIVSELGEIDAKMRQVHSGGPDASDPPVHFALLLEEIPAADAAAISRASDEIERLVAPYGPSLVRLFFRNIHRSWPVLIKARFLRLYHDEKLQLPASLRGAVYLLASAFWGLDRTLNGQCPYDKVRLESECLDALRREMICPNLATQQACLLLQHIQAPHIDTMESAAILNLAAQASVSAQVMGLHQDPSGWNIPSWEKVLRKRLWWATCISDAWAAQAFGVPPHIREDMYSTDYVEVSDLLFDEDVPTDLQHLVAQQDTVGSVESAAGFIAAARLSQFSSTILFASM